MQRQVASEQAASCQRDTLHITCGTLFSWRGTYPRSDSVGLPMWATITLSAPAAAAAAGLAWACQERPHLGACGPVAMICALSL